MVQLFGNFSFRHQAFLTGFICLFIAAGCSQQTETRWYKGNLHAHSYWSDGLHYPESVMKWYRDRDYNFAVLSEHNRFAEGEKWIEPQKGSLHETAFLEYLETFGKEWVEYEEQEGNYRVRLKTLEEYKPLFNEEEFIILKSEEITDEFENKPVHLNAANIRDLQDPRGGNSVAEVMQNNIDAVSEQRRQREQPMFAHLNHPNFLWAVTAGDYKELEGARFFEVYNGHPLVNNRGDSVRQGTEEIWDEVNTHYRLEEKPLLYGVAVDDTHDYHEFDKPRANPGRGWVQVRSRALHPDSLILAMERGDFYASTGVTLKDVQAGSESLSIEISPEDGVNYTIQFIGTLSDNTEQPGILLEQEEGMEATYVFNGNELFVRANIISDKPKENPGSEDDTVEMAWVQPIVQE